MKVSFKIKALGQRQSIAFEFTSLHSSLRQITGNLQRPFQRKKNTSIVSFRWERLKQVSIHFKRSTSLFFCEYSIVIYSWNIFFVCLRKCENLIAIRKKISRSWSMLLKSVVSSFFFVDWHILISIQSLSICSLFLKHFFISFLSFDYILGLNDIVSSN